MRTTSSWLLVGLLACNKQETAHAEDSTNVVTVNALDASAPVATAPSAEGLVATADAGTVAAGESPPDASLAPRAKPGACPTAPPGDVSSARNPGSCKTDADCTAGRQGRCKNIYLGHGRDAPTCTYDECSVDGDCKSPLLCFCGGSYSGRNVCLPGNCHVDADCKGQKCGEVPAATNGGYIPNGHFCHGPRDQCKDAASCGQNKTCGWVDEHARWECVPVVVPPPG